MQLFLFVSYPILTMNQLLDLTLADCKLVPFSESSLNSEAEPILFKNVLNNQKFSFLVMITIPMVQGTSVKTTKDVIDENAFVLKELGNFISSKTSKEIPTVIIYDKFGSATMSENVLSLPSSLSGFYTVTPTTMHQESDILRTFSVSKQLSISLIERTAKDKFQILTNSCHNILKSDSLPSWPWDFTNVDWIFKENMVKPMDNGVKQLKGYDKPVPYVKGIYFFNFMIPLCRNFTVALKAFYENALKNHGKNSFEIFGCMFDLEKHVSDDVLKSMPWCTLKCSKEQMDIIKYTFGVSHVPTLILLDKNNDVITKNGRWLVGADPEAKYFPFNDWDWYVDRPIEWKCVRPWNFYLIWDVPSLIVFGDAEDENYIDEWFSFVGSTQLSKFENLKEKNSLTKNQFLSRSCLLLFKCIDDDEFLVQYNLADLGVPLAIIFDPYSGVTICDEEHMSAEILNDFVKKYKNGQLEPTISPVPQFSSPLTPAGTNQSITLQTHKLESN
uniref:Thioredoxin-like fold domain-containing protein n=1 Tax=Panagrolaimus sp. JU765 TaxID=591449 RepID=A0AC34QKU8_9BILA